MEFGLLGPLLVYRDGLFVNVPAAKQRVILACLLLQPNKVVAVDRLMETCWDDAPPAAARAALHNYVNRLRQTVSLSA